LRLTHRAGKDRHARRHAIVYLFHDDRLRTIRDFAREFKPSNYRTWMHNDGILLCQLQACRRHLIAPNVITELDLEPCESLLLNSKQHDNVSATQGIVEMASDSQVGGQTGGNIGQQLGWAAKNHLCAEFC